MATVRRFEDLKCWQKARELANAIYDLTEQSHFARDYKLRDQIRDAAGSVMHNIAEGFDAGYNVEFIRFLKLARRSASEVQSQLYLALDRKYITQEELDRAYNLATQVKQLINALITYLRKHKSTILSQPNDDTMQRTNNSTTKRTNNPTMQRTNNPTTQRTNNPTTQRTNNPTTQRTNNPTTQRSNDATNKR